MESKLELATTRNINGITLNCYCENGQEYSGDFWATREQIGRFLGYHNPKNAIGKIHERNKERLDKFSTVRQIDTPSRGVQMTTVYSFKGLLEICRFSNQPKANEVIDILWDVFDEIRRTGMYITTQTMRQLEERVAKMEKQLDTVRPLITLGGIVLAQKGSVTFQNAAQFLSQHGIPIGQNRLFRYCREKGLLCSRRGRQYNKPTQRAIERGLFNLEVSGGFYAITLITPQGLMNLTNMLAHENYPLLMLMETAQGETE